MRRLWQFADFIRSVRRRMRFGELSRAPLKLLRVEFREDSVNCDWVVRPPDDWDSSLRSSVRRKNESLQALTDAITLRNLLFDALPDLDCAVLRAFRQPACEPPEVIILGTVSRETPEVHRTSSLVMRAKLYGFCFNWEDGVLKRLQWAEQTQELIT